MTASDQTSSYPAELPAADDTVPRCCEHHPDWATLTQHVIDDFPGIPIGDVVREVRRAKDAVDQVALTEDESMEIGELIVRHQLMMRAGLTREAARLDPETHVRAVN
jgi:hypothetical protein